MSTKASELKQLLEKRVLFVTKDLKNNGDKYNKLNIAIREYEILKLNQRLTQFN
jgi:hypothetical protein